MKFFRNLRIFVLFFAVLILVLGFTVLNAPKTVDAARLCCYRVCSLIPPYHCWDECKPCPTLPPLPPGP
jgi:hypothetical protein